MRPSVALRVRLWRAGATAGILGLLVLLLGAKAVPCAFARLVHVPCPGCGSTRAVLALVRGDWHDVFRYNPLGPFAALLIGLLSIQALVSVLVHGDFRAAGEGRLGLGLKRGIFVVAGLEVVLWIARFFGVLGGPVPVA